MSTYSTLSGRLVGTIKDNIKNMLKEFEVTEKIYREHVCNLPVEVQEDLTNLEVWTSNNLTFIENLNKGILSKTSKSNLVTPQLRVAACNDTLSGRSKELPDSVSAV